MVTTELASLVFEVAIIYFLNKLFYRECLLLGLSIDGGDGSLYTLPLLLELKTADIFVSAKFYLYNYWSNQFYK